MKSLLVTGSSGLIGSEMATYFARAGFAVHGVDNNGRADFFGPDGDTRWNQRRLVADLPNFVHHELDVRDRVQVLELVAALRPSAIVHTAGQPSHDLATQLPFEDFDTNATGTLNLLEAARRAAPEAPFVHLSTNKVYGDAPNELPLVELATRFDYERPEDHAGVAETTRIDRSLHSLFGASKVAADVMVQEYGRYFGMPTCCLRTGCVTGARHAGVELHGFLSYLVKCNVTGARYTVHGHRGKQVRDNLHAEDVARFAHAFIERPRAGETYNLGGGRGNSCSILEAFAFAEATSGRQMLHDYAERSRTGDHVCYMSNLGKIREHYPAWTVTRSLQDIFAELYGGWSARLT